jgi:hypothetical protein
MTAPLQLPAGLTFETAGHRYALHGERIAATVSAVSAHADTGGFSIGAAWSAKQVSMAMLKEIANANKDTDWTASVKWAKGAPARIRDAAAEAGTGFHAYAEAYCRALVAHDDALGLSPVPPELPTEPTQRRCAGAVRRFIEQHIRNPLGVEVRLLLPGDTPVAGTADLVTHLKGREGVFVVDWKGVSSLAYGDKASHVVQLEAYAAMLEASGNGIAGTCLVKIERDTGKIVASVFERSPEAMEIFHACLAIHEWRVPASTTNLQLEEEKNYG